MDPNATLNELRETLSELAGCGTDDTYAGGLIDRACELFGSLDHWLNSGGFKPQDWNKEQREQRQ